MDRERVLSVIRKHLEGNVEGLEGVAIDPGASTADLSASSLDIVEVVSCSIRELGIQVPRTELARARNLGELADIFLRASERSAAG